MGLLRKGEECCIGLAEEIYGSEEEFAKLMNQEAKDLGMNKTQFCNATGLHDPDHYTTAKDLATLWREALKNKDFYEIVTSASYSVEGTNLHPQGITFYSTLYQYAGTMEVTGGSILGGKTGYTDEAGLCLASLAKIWGREYLLVTANARGDHGTEQLQVDDARLVYNFLGDKMKESVAQP